MIFGTQAQIYDKNSRPTSPVSGQSVDAPYRITDDKGNERGVLMLSELEAGVLQQVLSKGDLTVAKFKVTRQ